MGAQRIAMDAARFSRLSCEAHAEASHRIARRVNPPVELNVDLHGQHVKEALSTVAYGLDTLQLSLPNLRRVRYVTGWGAHSNRRAAKLKPAICAFLNARGAVFEEAVGYVDVFFASRHEETTCAEEDCCVVCMDRPATVVLQHEDEGIGHRCVCLVCAPMLSGSPCPVCRRAVDSMMKIY